MAAVNIAFVGNVGGEPETKTFNDGSSLTTFNVGVSQGYFDRSKTWVDQGTMWIRVKPITKQATDQLRQVHKGAKVLVTGLLSQRFYTAKDGSQASSLECAAHAIGLMSRPPQQQQSGYQPPAQYRQQPSQQMSGGWTRESDPWASSDDDEFASPEF